MHEAHFEVGVHYINSVFTIKAVEPQFERYNFTSNTLTSIVTRQYKITRDLKKLGVKAYFEYNDFK